MTSMLLSADYDAPAWHAVLERLPVALRDIYFYPEYVRLHQAAGHSRAAMFVYLGNDHVWAYPFLLQCVPRLGTSLDEQDLYDIETPYGYGGPLSSSTEAGFLSEAHAAFSDWCRSTGVIAEFIRLHTLIPVQAWLDRAVSVIPDRTTLSIDLQKFSAEAPPFDKKTRYTLRQAQRAGLQVHTGGIDTFNEFERLYRRTMQKVGAKAFYFFSPEYFSALALLAARSGWLLLTFQDKTCVAAAVFLRGENWLHYHLSGSEPHSPAPGATNLLIFRAAQLGQAAGLQRLHLGGGLTGQPDDALFRFKQSMATDKHTFAIGKRIHNPKAYRTLRRAWATRYPALAARYGNQVLCYRHSGDPLNDAETCR